MGSGADCGGADVGGGRGTPGLVTTMLNTMEATTNTARMPNKMRILR